jgi:hypothetical protein
MKLLIQFAALLVTALLAVPPAVAEGICSFAQGAPQLSMDCCNADNVGSAIASSESSMAQGCLEGCCSLAPAQPPAPTVPDRFTSNGLNTFATPQTIEVALLPMASRIDSSATQARGRADFQSLLQIYRI